MFLCTVIIPTYNRPNQLKCCLESILGLDSPKDSFEVIVVDDGGKEPLDALISKFSDLNITLIRQVNQGPASARNQGAHIAKGMYLAFVDDDCTLKEDWLSTILNPLQQGSHHLVGGKTINNLPDNVYSVTSQLITDIVYNHYNKNKQQAEFFATNNFAIVASLFRELGGFYPDFRYAEDREFCDWYRYCGYKMYYCSEAIIYHAHNLSFRKYLRQHFGYGKGAYKFHKIRVIRKSGTIIREMKFHLKIKNWLYYPLQSVAKKDIFILSALLFCWQLANTFGFFYEFCCFFSGKRFDLFYRSKMCPASK